MGAYFSQAAIFLINVLIDLVYFVILLRFLFQLFRVDIYNPFSQLILKISNPILIPLHKILKNQSNVDCASFLLLMTLKALQLFLLTLIQHGAIPTLFSLLLWPIGTVMSHVLNIFFFSILLISLQSWLNPRNYNPLTDILIHLTEPLLVPARRFVPPLAGIDLSPLVVVISLKLIDVLIAIPLQHWGAHLGHLV
jgi:YggT family protein